MPFLHDIQAVSFDVGGTLIDPWPSVGHVYAQVATAHGWPAIDPQLLNRHFARAWKNKTNFDYSKTAWAQLVAKTFASIQPDIKITFFEALYDRFTHADAWRVYPDVHPALTALAQLGLPLAVISNWDDRLRPLLHNLSLQPFFKTILVSSELGSHKPESRIFSQAVQQLALPAHAILHIGDSLIEDAEGARAAGLRSILLDRHASAHAPGRIRSLQELL